MRPDKAWARCALATDGNSWSLETTEGIAEERSSVDVASREGCRMSKRSMLVLFESNGRGRSGLAVALPEQLSSADSGQGASNIEGKFTPHRCGFHRSPPALSL